jgi:magnesium chelatase family protein
MKVKNSRLDAIRLILSTQDISSQDELLKAPDGEKSAVIRERVIAARKIQSERFKKYSIHCNSQMNSRHLQQFCQLDSKCMMLMRHAIEHLKLSPRAYDRILKVSRTIADLAGSERITENHIFEAVQYRKNGIGDE